MRKTQAEVQKAYRDRKRPLVEMAQTMFEFLKREQHFYQERSPWPSKGNRLQEELYRIERARIIEAVLAGKPYKPEFEYPYHTPEEAVLEARFVDTEEDEAREDEAPAA